MVENILTKSKTVSIFQDYKNPGEDSYKVKELQRFSKTLKIFENSPTRSKTLTFFKDSKNL